MGRQSSRIYFNGQDHKEIYFNGSYHNAMYIGSQLVWQKLESENKSFAIVDYTMFGEEIYLVVIMYDYDISTEIATKEGIYVAKFNKNLLCIDLLIRIEENDGYDNYMIQSCEDGFILTIYDSYFRYYALYPEYTKDENQPKMLFAKHPLTKNSTFKKLEAGMIKQKTTLFVPPHTIKVDSDVKFCFSSGYVVYDSDCYYTNVPTQHGEDYYGNKYYRYVIAKFDYNDTMIAYALPNLEFKNNSASSEYMKSMPLNVFFTVGLGEKILCLQNTNWTGRFSTVANYIYSTVVNSDLGGNNGWITPDVWIDKTRYQSEVTLNDSTTLNVSVPGQTAMPLFSKRNILVDEGSIYLMARTSADTTSVGMTQYTMYRLDNEGKGEPIGNILTTDEVRMGTYHKLENGLFYLKRANNLYFFDKNGLNGNKVSLGVSIGDYRYGQTVVIPVPIGDDYIVIEGLKTRLNSFSIGKKENYQGIVRTYSKEWKYQKSQKMKFRHLEK